MMNKKIVLFLVFVGFSLFACGQSDSLFVPILNDTITLDTADISQKLIESKEEKKGNFVQRFFREGYPSPKKAVILTGVLPGLGQIYNKKHWYIKLPIIYGAFGGVIYAANFNSKQYKRLQENYVLLASSDPLVNEQSEFFGRVSKEVIKQERDKHDKWRQMSYIGIGLAYILTAAEAYTTAHLLSFDVNDDLSLRVKPTFDFVPQEGAVVGVGFNLHLSKKQSDTPKLFFD